MAASAAACARRHAALTGPPRQAEAGAAGRGRGGAAQAGAKAARGACLLVQSFQSASKIHAGSFRRRAYALRSRCRLRTTCVPGAAPRVTPPRPRGACGRGARGLRRVAVAAAPVPEASSRAARSRP